MTAYSFSLTVGGKAFPVTNFSVTSGAYGSVGHLTTSCSITLLNALGIDIYSMTAEATAPVEVILLVTVDTTPPVRVFGGEFLHSRWMYDRDQVEIHARDWAGQLVDQKRTLTKIAAEVTKLLAPLVPGQNPASQGTSNVNQTLANIITSIAQEFNMTPVLNLSGGAPSGTIIGTLYGQDNPTFISIPQSLWEILNQLARDTGYDVYVTPNRQLVFGQAAVGIPPLNLTWKKNPVPKGAFPCRDLLIEHHPRRNATFRVLVLSYDPGKGQQTTGYATVVGANLAGSAGLKPGIWVGPDAIKANAQLAAVKPGVGVSATQVPLYSFRLDGLSQDQATLRAQTIAIDIAKRELILSCEIDGYPGATPTGQINISGPIDPNFAGNAFYFNGYEHVFRMPGGGGGGGFITRIKALDIPTLGTGAGGNADGPLI